MIWFSMACSILARKPVAPTPPAIEPEIVSTVDFNELESTIREMYSDADGMDSKDRLLLHQDLIRVARFADPEIQKSVYYYIQENLRIERRSLPMDIQSIDLSMQGVAEQEIKVDLSEVRKLVEESKYDAAIMALSDCRLSDGDCEAMWIEVVDKQVEKLRLPSLGVMDNVLAKPPSETRQQEIDELVLVFEELLSSYPSTTLAPTIRSDIERLVRINKEAVKP